MIDVKELTPEFFFMPEFLSNMNNFDLGRRQTGELLNSIVLPPWAQTPEDFIRINREALESEYVSLNLHKWIDLIFGNKQQGEEAVKADNIFYYLTYEGAVDLEKIADPHERRAIQDQINYFGQTPTQLLTRAHLERNPCDPGMKASILERISEATSRVPKVNLGQPVCFLGSFESGERLIFVGKDRSVNSAKVDLSNGRLLIDPATQDQHHYTSPVAHDVTLSPSLFAVTRDGRLLFTCGHWDNSFKMTTLEGKRYITTFTPHNDVVTCLALSDDGKCLATGSRDTTAMTWRLESSGPVPILKKGHAFYGHDQEVTCIAVNTEYDLLLTGSRDGTCIMHSLRAGTYIRQLNVSRNKELSLPTQIGISSQGSLVISTTVGDIGETLHFNINGKFLWRLGSFKCNQFALSKDGKFIIFATESSIRFHWLHKYPPSYLARFNYGPFFHVDFFPHFSLSKIRKMEVLEPGVHVNCVSVSDDGNYAIGGLSSGKMQVIGEKSTIFQLAAH